MLRKVLLQEKARPQRTAHGLVEYNAVGHDQLASINERKEVIWYFKIMGGHTHVRVFMNGGKCGDLCFRNEEFEQVKACCPWIQYKEEL